MKELCVFEEEEYIKLMNTLGIALEEEECEDKSVYFNAGNFGQEKGEFEFNIEVVPLQKR